MLRRMIETLAIVVALAVLAVLGAARLWPEPGSGFYWRVAALMERPTNLGPIDFASLQRRSAPNDSLVCPEGLCKEAKSDFPAPIFALSPQELRAKVASVAHSEPNSIELPREANCDVSARFVEYSVLFRFPDIIDVRTLPADGKTSTIAIYSRSVVGRGDRGVNHERVRRWLATLQRITPRP